MRYMLLMYRDEQWWNGKPEEERAAIRQQAGDRPEDPTARGLFPAGAPLPPGGPAAAVGMRNGKPVATDGPFAETKEQLGGYTIVDAPSLDEARAIALDHPRLRVAGHSIEIRAIRELPPTR